MASRLKQSPVSVRGSKYKNRKQPFYHISNGFREVAPVDGLLALVLQQFVALGEMFAAEEAPVGRERTGVDAGQHVVLLLVHLVPLLANPVQLTHWLQSQA